MLESWDHWSPHGYPMVVKVSLGRLLNEGFKLLIYLAAVQFTNCVFKLAPLSNKIIFIYQKKGFKWLTIFHFWYYDYEIICDDYLCRRVDEAENVPISLDLNNVKHKREESLLQIRTNPPSPQCFSATRGPTKITPSKATKSRMMVCTLKT